MEIAKQRISVCLVVYNEEEVIDRCLRSVQGLADEIILVHDGDCTDKTLDIAKRYTDKIFIQPHIGEAEPHRAFTFKQASGEWIFQIDADEFVDNESVLKIKHLIQDNNLSGAWFKWEMWDGQKALYFKGLKKLCLFRKSSISYIGVPHASVKILQGREEEFDIFLRHRPRYNNIAWRSFLKKANKWVPVHAKYFFPKNISLVCFNDTAESWVAYANKVKDHIVFYIIFSPLKMLFGQLKNGLWTNWVGLNLSLQQYVYYLFLFITVFRMRYKLYYKK